ncbi:MAG: hypothetical protein CMP22_05160 [Rickettsiales bacterium]|nr:hypothetical protein [Rickettsiales bacterium]|tara:strand:- start:1625 stop:2950 length:1326 start_codon:yes stop_codon:yes gene_type:complete
MQKPVSDLELWLNEILAIYVSPHISIEELGQKQTTLIIAGSAQKIIIKKINSLWDINNKRPSYTINDDNLPLLGSKNIDPIFEVKDNNLYVNYDILGLAFWMLCRVEEVNVQKSLLDKHDRFPAIASHAYQNHYIERPIVDEWFYCLRNKITEIFPSVALTNHCFEMRVSHDVDEPSRYGFKSFKKLIRIMLGDLLKRKNIKGFLRAPLVKLTNFKSLSRFDEKNTFDWIMNLSEKHNLKSAFYFICGRTDPSKDSDYEVEHPAIKNLISKIHERGHEVGLHPSYNTFRNKYAIDKEKNRLINSAKSIDIDLNNMGVRMHYLRFSWLETIQHLNDCGFEYDTTIGYADMAGFRCGTCHEYPAFNPVTNTLLNIKIRPLIAMETTLVSEHYMNLGTGDKAYQKLLMLKNKCKDVGGNFTLLWHNSNLCDKDMRSLYQKILDE